MDASIKPGWQTTEFWAPLISLIVTALVTFHFVPSADATSIMGCLSSLIVGLAGVVGNTMLVLHYIRSRTELKEKLANVTINQAQQRACMIAFSKPASCEGPTLGIGPIKMGAVPESPPDASQWTPVNNTSADFPPVKP